MKLRALSIAVIVQTLSLNAMATEIVAGADFAPLVSWADNCVLLWCGENERGGRSSGYGLRVGVWLPPTGRHKTGLEFGYDNPGSLSGSTAYSLAPGCLILCQTARSSWKHETRLIHVSVIRAVAIDERDEYGAFLARVGLYRSMSDSVIDYGQGGGAKSHHENTTGLMLGAGFLVPLTERLWWRVAANIFVNVNVTDPIKVGSNLPETLFILSLGLDYGF